MKFYLFGTLFLAGTAVGSKYTKAYCEPPRGLYINEEVGKDK